MQEILDGICKKMIRRHPHIFPTEADASPKSWEELKREEKGFLTKKESLEKISRSLPSPMRAQKIIRKTEALSSSEAAKKGTPNDLGERFYALCREAAQAGWDAEELFNHYLDSVIEKCTIYE
jgi:tetrapyrrole methylase family protein/MazG family protein